MSRSRCILHVDMDAFYASVEVRDNPSLAGLPLVVGGMGGRGVVAAASYEVRRFGVHSAMPMSEAKRRCPQLVCVAPRMARYRQVSELVFSVFEQFTPQIEGLSLDEAYLDISASLNLFGSPRTIGEQIKKRIYEATGLCASVGAGPNKLVAKIASDMDKPNGLRIIEDSQVAAIFRALPVYRLHGIGKKTAAQLEALGIATCGDLSQATDAQLKPVFGRYASAIRARARGQDDRAVVSDWEEKQVSAEETFAVDLHRPEALRREIVGLADRAASRLRHKALVTCCVTVKIRTADFQTLTRSHTFAPPTDDTRQITQIAQHLLQSWRALVPDDKVRLLGVSLRDLAPATQLDLFASAAIESSVHTQPNGQQATKRLDPLLDGIRGRFGAGAVTRASALPTKTPPDP